MFSALHMAGILNLNSFLLEYLLFPFHLPPTVIILFSRKAVLEIIVYVFYTSTIFIETEK